MFARPLLGPVLVVVLAMLFSPCTRSAIADPGAAPAPREYRVLQKLHTDAIATFLDGGALTLATRADVFEGIGTRLDPDRVWFHIDDASRVTVPAGMQFIAPAGTQVWLAPQNNPSGTQLWPGFSTESVPAGAVDQDRTTLTLTDVQGPGALELFTTDGFGTPTRLWSSDEGIDSFEVGRTHMHANWAFTQPGTYRVAVRAAARRAGQPVSATATYTFVVGPLPGIAATTTTLATSATEITAGQSIDLSATVTPSSVSGFVEYRSGATVLGHEAAIGGKATLATDALALGVHSVTAHFVPGVRNLAAPSTSAPVEVAVTEPGGGPFGIAGVAAFYRPGEVLDARVVGATAGAGQDFQWMIRPAGSEGAGTVIAGTGTRAATGRLEQRLDASYDDYELSVRLRSGATVEAQTGWTRIAVEAAVEPLDVAFAGPSPAYVGDTIAAAVSGRAPADGETVVLVQRTTGRWSAVAYTRPLDAGRIAVEPFTSFSGQWALQVVRDGLIVAQSEPIRVEFRTREVFIEGLQSVYRPGQTLRATGTVFPESEGLIYQWVLLTSPTQVLKSGTGPEALTLELPVTLAHDDVRLLLVALRDYGDRFGNAGQTLATVNVSQADPSTQLFFFNSLIDHYHQGGAIDLRLAADPPPAAGDRIAWEWKWPGGGWASFPGAAGLAHPIVAEQALDGVQVRATLTFAGGGDPIVAPPVTVRVDDHGAAPDQKLTVTGATAYREGDAATLTAHVAPATVLDRYQWFHRAPGAAEATAIEGATNATYSFTATAAHHGRQYSVAVVKPGGELAYGPSTPVQLTVEANPGPFGIAGVRDSYDAGDTLEAHVVGASLGEGQDFQWRIRPVGSTGTGSAITGTGSQAPAGRLVQRMDPSFDGYELSVRLRTGTTVVEQTGWTPIRARNAVEPVSPALAAAGPLHLGDDILVRITGRELADGETVRLVTRSTGLWSANSRATQLDARTFRVQPLSAVNASWALQVLHAGLVVAQSASLPVSIPAREVLVDGIQSVYRPGQTLRATGTVHPELQSLTYRWILIDLATLQQRVVKEGTGAEAKTLELPITLAHDNHQLTFGAVRDYGGSVVFAGQTGTRINVSDADPSTQVFLMNPLAGHYHQGGAINLRLAADPPPAAGDRIAWEWRWPGQEWAPFPGASGMLHPIVAEQALDGVQVRATLTVAAGGSPMVAGPVTIHVDDHGAAPRQQVTVAGETALEDGDVAVLSAQVAPATLLDRYQWYEHAPGAAQPTAIPGATAAEHSFAATAARDGHRYSVAVVKPGGQVAYGPSTPVELTVQPRKVAVEQAVGGSVPATLALALGAPASFGAFTPGVAREYTASTTATLTSSAGDATLDVSDPSSDRPGHLVNGTFALARPLRGLGIVKAYDGPAANDTITVEFTQAIAAGEMLRTGSYAKTLSFTLSTTTP